MGRALILDNPQQIGVANLVEFLGVAAVEQRTKPSSLDGWADSRTKCPMFA